MNGEDGGGHDDNDGIARTIEFYWSLLSIAKNMISLTMFIDIFQKIFTTIEQLHHFNLHWVFSEVSPFLRWLGALTVKNSMRYAALPVVTTTQAVKTEPMVHNDLWNIEAVKWDFFFGWAKKGW